MPDEEEQPFINEKSEADGLHERHSALLRSHRRLGRWTVASNVVLAAIVVTLVVLRVTSHDGDHSSPVPTFPTKRVLFEQDDLFAGELSAENDAAWGSLNPPGDGFVLIANPRNHNLPPGIQTDQGELYDISLFHQLHCLGNIRTYLYTMKDSIKSNTTQQAQELVLAHEGHHIHHCFDYIRQALMCAADMTPEWPMEGPEGEKSAVNGWGIEHECKDWSAVMKYMEENNVMAHMWDEPL
ncbi:hypothetical protein MBLNU230_g3696t1 [Neophaeotheca triangularis]